MNQRHHLQASSYIPGRFSGDVALFCKVNEQTEFTWFPALRTEAQAAGVFDVAGIVGHVVARCCGRVVAHGALAASGGALTAVGVNRWHPEPDAVEVVKVMSVADHQHMGSASLVLETLLAAVPHRQVFLETLTDLRGFYERFGFYVVDHRRAPSGRQIDVLVRRPGS